MSSTFSVSKKTLVRKHTFFKYSPHPILTRKLTFLYWEELLKFFLKSYTVGCLRTLGAWTLEIRVREAGCTDKETQAFVLSKGRNIPTFQPACSSILFPPAATELCWVGSTGAQVSGSDPRTRVSKHYKYLLWNYFQSKHDTRHCLV